MSEWGSGQTEMTAYEHDLVAGIMLDVVRDIVTAKALAPLPDGYRGYVVDELFARGLEHLNGTRYVEEMDLIAAETGFARWDDAAMGRG